jgi:hypothetical protein
MRFRPDAGTLRAVACGVTHSCRTTWIGLSSVLACALLLALCAEALDANGALRMGALQLLPREGRGPLGGRTHPIVGGAVNAGGLTPSSAVVDHWPPHDDDVYGPHFITANPLSDTWYEDLFSVRLVAGAKYYLKVNNPAPGSTGGPVANFSVMLGISTRRRGCSRRRTRSGSRGD